MMRAAGRVVSAMILTGSVVLVGCASTIDGTGRAGEVDVRTLDTGRFPTRSPTFTAQLSRSGYVGLEAARMADAVLSPHVVDADYALGATASAHTAPESVTRYLLDTTVPVLRRYGMIVGFSTAAADTRVPPEKALHDTSGQQREGLTVTVTRFPDDSSARAAAVELDAVDAAANPDNVAVQLSRFPRAASHWRPSLPTLGSTTPHGVFVISIYAVTRDANLTVLTDMTQKYLDAEVAALDAFTPTPVGKLSELRQDPDRLLSRTLHDNGVVGRPDGNSEVVYTARGYLNYVLDQPGRSKVLVEAGVDRVAVAPSTFAFRTRDVTSARRWVRDSAELGDAADRQTVDPPVDVPDSACVEDRFTLGEARFRCFVAYGRYGVLVLGSRLWETQQRAAAQYALLVDSGA